MPVDLPLLPPPLMQAAFFAAFLAVASVFDLHRRIVPNTICALIAGVGLIQFRPFRVLGVLAAMPLLIAALCKEGSMGGGDIKLTAAAGSILGLRGGLFGLSVGLALALMFYASREMYANARQMERDGQGSIPLAPFLSLGFMVAYFIYQ